jgi:hypothetical protein
VITQLSCDAQCLSLLIAISPGLPAVHLESSRPGTSGVLPEGEKARYPANGVPPEKLVLPPILAAVLLAAADLWEAERSHLRVFVEHLADLCLHIRLGNHSDTETFWARSLEVCAG